MRPPALSGPVRSALRFRRQDAYMMFECMVYLGVLFALLGVGYIAMYRCIDRSVALRRSADALTSALHAGEHWRADLRSAIGPVQRDNQSPGLRIPTARGDILYRFETNTILRQAGSNSCVQLLSGVKSSDMLADPRDRVTAWRWELELLPIKKDTANTNRVRPLFTFLAVPAAPSAK